MIIRHAQPSDTERIMLIIADAQRFLRDCDVDQWQDGYPTTEIICSDIEQGYSYVATTESDEVVAVATISFDGESTYDTIRNGAWTNDEPYAVIHRLAVSDMVRGQGLAKAMFSFAEELCKQRAIRNIRVDTHADNRVMQQLLERLGYDKCGEITLTSGASRLAYIKTLD